MVLVASSTTLSVSANSKSAEQITGQFQFVSKGILRVYARSSATGLNITSSVNGVPLVNDSLVPYFGTTGGLSKNDHMVAESAINGGYLSLTFRNTTGGALTVDYLIEWIPTK